MKFSTEIFSRVTTKDKAMLARQLATMLSSGIAIDQSFKILASQTPRAGLKRSFQTIVADLEQGNNLAFSLSKHRNIFDPVFIAIVRSGESSGKLDVVLDQLAERLEQSDDFNSKIKAALYYPLFIILTMIVIVVLMMIYIIPQLKTVFEDNGLTLPWTTKLIISVSNFTVQYWWVELIVAAILGVALILFLRSTEGGNYWDRIKIKIPIVSQLFKLIYMARFCRTMSMLLQAGLPIMETIAITADVIQNHVFTVSLKAIAAQVERGIPMSVPMQKDKHYPVLVSEMVMVGEQTGKMGQILTKLADYYERETATMIKGLSSLIEPVIIVIVGAGVGFLVFSIIWPIYGIAQTGF